MIDIKNEKIKKINCYDDSIFLLLENGDLYASPCVNIPGNQPGNQGAFIKVASKVNDICHGHRCLKYFVSNNQLYRIDQKKETFINEFGQTDKDFIIRQIDFFKDKIVKEVFFSFEASVCHVLTDDMKLYSNSSSNNKDDFYLDANDDIKIKTFSCTQSCNFILSEDGYLYGKGGICTQSNIVLSNNQNYEKSVQEFTKIDFGEKIKLFGTPYYYGRCRTNDLFYKKTVNFSVVVITESGRVLMSSVQKKNDNEKIFAFEEICNLKDCGIEIEKIEYDEAGALLHIKNSSDILYIHSYNDQTRFPSYNVQFGNYTIFGAELLRNVKQLCVGDGSYQVTYLTNNNEIFVGCNINMYNYPYEEKYRNIYKQAQIFINDFEGMYNIIGAYMGPSKFELNGETFSPRIIAYTDKNNRFFLATSKDYSWKIDRRGFQTNEPMANSFDLITFQEVFFREDKKHIFPLKNVYNFTTPRKLKELAWKKGIGYTKKNKKWAPIILDTEDETGQIEFNLNFETMRYPETLPGMGIRYGSWTLRADGLTQPYFDYPGKGSCFIGFTLDKDGPFEATINYGGRCSPYDILGFTITESKTPPTNIDTYDFYVSNLQKTKITSHTISKELTKGIYYLHITFLTSNPHGVTFDDSYLYVRDVDLKGNLFIGETDETFEPLIFNPNAVWNVKNTWLRMGNSWNGEKKIIEIKKGENNVIQ